MASSTRRYKVRRIVDYKERPFTFRRTGKVIIREFHVLECGHEKRIPTDRIRRLDMGIERRRCYECGRQDK